MAKKSKAKEEIDFQKDLAASLQKEFQYRQKINDLLSATIGHGSTELKIKQSLIDALKNEEDFENRLKIVDSARLMIIKKYSQFHPELNKQLQIQLDLAQDIIKGEQQRKNIAEKSVRPHTFFPLFLERILLTNS